MLKFMYITNNVKIAKIAEEAGVDRIWIDLEKLGKEERQKGLNTVKSQHCFSDISKIKSSLEISELIVRIDPINKCSKNDIEKVINEGADLIMLPMFKTVEEVKYFIEQVNGRCKTVLLLETKEAVDIIDQILDLPGIDEIHIGLNDLSLSYGHSFLFEPLSNGMVDNLCEKFRKKNIPYGFGGIARIGEGLLPAENIITEHFRLGSSRVILSRSFCDVDIDENENILRSEFLSGIQGIKSWEKILQYVDNEYYNFNKIEVNSIISKLIQLRKEKI